MANKLVLGCLTFFTHVVMAVQPPPYNVLLTYPALGYVIGGSARTVDFVFSRGDERIYGEAPPKEKLQKFRNVDYYITIGAPVEKEIEKTLLELNPRIKVFVATNGCHMIEGNYYPWYYLRNIDEMAWNCRRALKSDVVSLGCIDIGALENSCRGEKMTVGVMHDAFEYWCRFWGIRYLRLPENISDADMMAKDIRLVYKARLGHKVRVIQPVKSTITIVEADPFEFEHSYELYKPYLKVLRAFRLEEEEKKWKMEEEKEQKEKVRAEKGRNVISTN